MKRILVLGAGGAAANGFSRALKLAGGYHLIGTNCNDYDLELAETDEEILIPSADEDEYGNALLRLAERVDLVHAQNDAEVWQLSLLRDRLPVFLPRHHVIKVCQDKWKSHCFWRDNVPQPDTRLIMFAGDLEAMFDKHNWLWLRNIRGAGGAGSIATNDREVGKAWLDHQHGWGEFTAAQVLTELTATWTALFVDGDLVVGQGRRRLSWAYARNQPSGVSGITGVGETFSGAELAAVSLEAIICLDRTPHGLYGVDCALDSEDRWNPTEINIGRFHTTVPEFFARAGMNIADIYCRAYFREERGPTPPLPDGFRWLRTMDKSPCLLPP